MKKNLFLMLIAALLLSSCNNAGEGAVVGGHFGYVLGSAIGGITGGGRGHDWGALIGTVGGVATGAAIGAATEDAREEKYRERAKERLHRQDGGYENRDVSRYDDQDYYDPLGRGDDRIDLDLGRDRHEPPLEIRNATFTESRRDGVLTRGEECTVRFEIFNTSGTPVYDIKPIVSEVTGNKHVRISQNLNIKSIGPYKGVRYTATVKADKKLKEGQIEVMVAVSSRRITAKSQTRYFNVPTAKY